MTETKVKSFLDYDGLTIYTQEMLKWAGESLTKFEYTKVDTIPLTYIPDETLPRYIYMYDSDNDSTLDLYMYVLITPEDTDAPTEATYKLIQIGSIALDLADYYTKDEIELQLGGYVNKEDDDYKLTKQLAAQASKDAEAALKRAGTAEAVANGAASDAGVAKSLVMSLAGRVAILEENGVGGGCNCTAIEGDSIRSLFAALD